MIGQSMIFLIMWRTFPRRF